MVMVIVVDMLMVGGAGANIGFGDGAVMVR